jgi:excisionase family DNA binding protein
MTALKTVPASEQGLQLLRIQDFAARLGISVWTARAWAYAGKISSVKVGARLQVPESEVARIITENLRPRVASVRVARPRCAGGDR